MNSASEPNLDGLIDALSAERFERYRAAGSGDDAKALALHEWNLRLCSVFYFPLHTIEIGFRNSCHKELTHHFGPDWPHDTKFRSVDAHYSRQIDKAIAASNAHDAKPPVPKIVASLDFGFWTSLLQPKLTDRYGIRLCQTHFFIEGIAVRRVMTDNGKVFLSRPFLGELQLGTIKHYRTQRYTPRVNGKAERFIRTMLGECVCRDHGRHERHELVVEPASTP